MPDEDADRHPATSGNKSTDFRWRCWWFLIAVVITLSISGLNGEETPGSHQKSNKDMTTNKQQSQRTDYGPESSHDFRSPPTRVNDTNRTTRRRYPPSLLRDMVTQTKRKRGKPEVAPEMDFPLSYERRRTSSSSAAAAAIFLQASKSSMRGDKMLKSSKDALIVTKKSYLKKDWCKTEPLIQRVREIGCFTRTVVNRFCYGQCNSFYIPKNAVPAGGSTSGSGSDLDQTSFKSCAFCKPKRFRWITITLHCPGRNPPYKKKRIQRIRKCKCISEILQ